MERRKFLRSVGVGGLVLAGCRRVTIDQKYAGTLKYDAEEALVRDKIRQLYDKHFPVSEKKNAAADINKYNVLLITSDQQHIMTLGINNKNVKTPNLDRLAAMGIVFDRAYCNNPTSTPTRASIITGKYASQHGAYALGTSLPESELRVGEVFVNSGYRTALIGNAHFQQLKGTHEYPTLEGYPVLQDLDFWNTFHGPFYGFEHVELARNHTDEAHVGQHYALWMEENGAKDWRKWFRKPTGLTDGELYTWDIPEKYHYNNWITERTNAMLQSYKEKNENFFLWASYFDPHPSYLIPEPWASMYKPEDMDVPEIVPGELDDMPPSFRKTQEEKPELKEYYEEKGNGVVGLHSHLGKTKEEKAKDMAVYFGMVSMLDHYIGKVLDKLDELKLTEKTLVVFTTDHGHFYGQHGLIAKGPYHYEDVIKIPFIVSLPGSVPQGKRSDAFQSTVDLAPTMLSFAGIEIPSCMTGVDQKDVWLGKTESVRDHIIVENRAQPTTISLKTYVEKNYKITVYANQPYGEIFDLKNDPDELVNLWDKPGSAGLRNELLLKLIHAEMAKEPVLMPRVSVA